MHTKAKLMLCRPNPSYHGIKRSVDFVNDDAYRSWKNSGSKEGQTPVTMATGDEAMECNSGSATCDVRLASFKASSLPGAKSSDYYCRHYKVLTLLQQSVTRHATLPGLAISGTSDGGSGICGHGAAQRETEETGLRHRRGLVKRLGSAR